MTLTSSTPAGAIASSVDIEFDGNGIDKYLVIPLLADIRGPVNVEPRSLLLIAGQSRYEKAILKLHSSSTPITRVETTLSDEVKHLIEVRSILHGNLIESLQVSILPGGGEAAVVPENKVLGYLMLKVSIAMVQ